MRAGQLRHHVKIHKSTGGRSPTGGPGTITWTHTLTLWAAVEFLSVKDVIASQAAKTEITARCKMRYRTDINSGMRIEHMAQTYEIIGAPQADNDSGREYMTLMLKALK